MSETALLGESVPAIARPTLVAPPARAAAKPGIGRRVRTFVDDVWLATQAMQGHPLRAALTLLGIVIGVFTVVVMMALTTGLQNALSKGMGGLGANVFQLQKFPAVNFGPDKPEVMKRKNLTLPQALHLRDLLPQAKQVGGEVWQGGKEVSTTETTMQGVQVAGGTAEFFTNNSLPIGRGRGFGEGEALSAARVVVLGAAVVDSLFPDRDPIGNKVRLGRLELEVVGTLERQGSNPMGDNPDTVAAIPIGLFFDLYGNARSVNITVMAEDGYDLKKLMDQATAAFRIVRGLRSDQDEDFDMYSNESIKAVFDNIAGVVQLFALAVCALSLLVGGIGVMNIMLVAVAERTREIGLRKALGARPARVLMQFVIEAVLLAFVGGVLGVLLGYGASAVVKFGFNLPTQVPVWAVALALGVSSAIGLVFGIYPAARASKLDPAVALRNE
jgi:putative ABC transport system permease protein